MSGSKICDKIIYSEEQINEAIKRLGRKITKDYYGKDVLFIVVLNGAYMFAAELTKRVNINSYIDFIQVSTYENNTKSSDEFKIKKDLSADVGGKNIIIVEDILDTGFTLKNLIEYISSKNPSSIKVAALIDKPARRKQNVKADYVGFVMDKDRFVVGYGLDYAQKYRNLPYIGILNEDLH